MPKITFSVFFITFFNLKFNIVHSAAIIYSHTICIYFMSIYYSTKFTYFSRSNSPDSAGPRRKLVLCVQLLSCAYISSMPVQQCVHFPSTASQQLCVHYLTNTVKMCIHLLSTAVYTFAGVYTAVQ